MGRRYRSKDGERIRYCFSGYLSMKSVLLKKKHQECREDRGKEAQIGSNRGSLLVCVQKVGIQEKKKKSPLAEELKQQLKAKPQMETLRYVHTQQDTLKHTH